MSRTGLDAADFYVAQRQLRWLGHVSRMDFGTLVDSRAACSQRGCRISGLLARRGSHQAHIRPRDGQGHMDVFDLLDPSRWHELVGDRAVAYDAL